MKIIEEMAGCPAEKSPLDLQLPDLSVPIVDDLLRVCLTPAPCCPRKQLARTCHQLCFKSVIGLVEPPNFHRQLHQGLLPESAVNCSHALNSALCCFLFTPTSHPPLDRVGV